MPARPIQYISRPGQLGELLDDLAESSSVAFDTEFVGERLYQPELCLVQLATARAVYIVDPLSLTDFGSLWELITAPERQMIALAAREEVRFCLRYAGRAPANLFDPQLAAGMLGWGYPVGHTQLVQRVLKVSIAGSESLTDWRQRPLSNAQIEYAADDVRYLHQMREQLLIQAGQLDQSLGTGPRADWIDSECAAYVQRICEDEDEERWWKVAGASNLSRRDKAVLRQVWRWREETAYQKNIPPRWVLRDELLVQIAKRKPTETAGLYALRGFERNDARDKGPHIVRAVREALALSDEQLPAVQRSVDPPQVQVLTQMLAVVAAGIAAQQSLDPQLMAPSAAVQALVRWVLGGRPEEKPWLLRGWRGELLGEPLLSVLEGRSQILVEDIGRPNPLAIRALA